MLFEKLSLTFLIAVTFIPDAMKYSQIGVLKALGIQDKGLFTSLVGNWVFNLSFMYIFIFRLDYGLHGIWISKFISDTCIFISNVSLVNVQDWEEISEEFHHQRNQKDTESKSTTDDDEYQKLDIV